MRVMIELDTNKQMETISNDVFDTERLTFSI